MALCCYVRVGQPWAGITTMTEMGWFLEFREVICHSAVVLIHPVSLCENTACFSRRSSHNTWRIEPIDERFQLILEAPSLFSQTLGQWFLHTGTITSQGCE